MRFFLTGLLLALSPQANAANQVCNFQISNQYWVEKSCRVGDVVTGNEITDGVLKVKCGRPLVLCNFAPQPALSTPHPEAGQLVDDQNFNARTKDPSSPQPID